MVFVVGLVVLFVLAIAVFSFWPQDQNVKIGYQRTLLYLPLFVAEKEGLFEKEGVRVKLEEFGSANLMMQALLSGQIDATGMSALNVLATVEDQQPGQFKMFLFEVFSKDQHADHILVPSGSSVSSLADLKGKRIGVHPGTTIRMYARVALGRFMDSDKDVEFVELEPPLQIQAIAAGQVDAVFALEPVPATCLAKGIARDLGGFISEYTIDPTYAGSAVFSTSFVEEEPEHAQKVQRALYRALEIIRSDPDRARTILGQYLNLAPDVLGHLTMIGWAKVEEIDRPKVRDLLDLYQKHGVIESTISLEDSYFRAKGGL
jgi:NitT/TauT family transport system substrate-binding protein